MRNYLRYSYAVLALPVVILTRFALLPLTGHGTPFITLFPATVIIALLGGMGPAILTGVLGVLVTDYFFIPPLHSWDIGIEFWSRTAVVVLASVFVGYVGRVLRVARAKAEKQAIELHQSREDLKRAQTVALTGSWRLDVRRDELAWSDEAYRIFGVPAGTALTYESFLSRVHPDDRHDVDEKWKAALKGEKYDIEHRIIVDGQTKWVRERAELEHDENGMLSGGFGTVTNITERKKREQELYRLNKTLRALSNSTQAIIHAGDEQHYLQRVCDIIVKDCGHAMVWIGFAEDDEAKSVRPVAYSGFEKGYLETLKITWADTERGRGPTGTAIRTTKTTFCKDILTNPAFEPWRDEAAKRGYASSVSLPLLSGGKAFGALTIYSKEPDPFLQDEVQLLAELVSDLSFGISSIRLRNARDAAEKALRESEKKYRELVQNANSAIIRWDRNGKITLFNEYAQHFFGYSADEMLGARVDILLPQGQSKQADMPELVRNIVNDPQRYINNINENVCKNGRRVWMAWTNKPIYDENGYVLEMLAVGTDITTQKAAEEALQKERDFIAAVLNTAGALVVVLDKEGRITRFNHECEEVTGYTSDEVLGRVFWEFLVPKEELPGVQLTWATLCAGDFPEDYENHWIAKDGSQYLISWSNTAIVEPNAQIEYIIGTGVDITERKRMEEEIRRSRDELEIRVQERTRELMAEGAERRKAEELVKAERQRLNDVLETLPAYVCLLTPDYYMPFANRVFRELFGYYPDKKCYEFLFGRPEPCEDCQTYAVLKTNTPQRWEWTGPNGRNYDIFDYPFRDSDGSQLILEMGIDVTEQKQAERKILDDQEQLRALTAELMMVEERERRKIASELHDSVGQILAFLKIELGELQRSELSKDSVNTIHHVREQVEQAIKQTRTLTFEMSPPELYTLGLGPAVEELAQRFTEARNINCSVDCVGEPQPLTDSAKILLYRSVRELLINTAKHAGAKTVAVKIRWLKDGIRITVEDNGTGFDTTRPERTTRGKPAGFGLFSIRERLNHIGGRLDIQSSSGKGTRVTLLAPLECEAPK